MWTYKTDAGEETVRIVKVEEKDGATLITTEHIRAGDLPPYHTTVSIRPTGVFLVAEDGRTYRAPWCVFKLPHKDGDTWKTDGHGGDMKAGPTEKLKLPFGEVVAGRIEWSVGNRPVTYWFAHGIGLVKMQGAANKELKSITYGK
ncbi:MAG: hypothetical protein FJ304_25095 [Planctomycetes bacterium]|nr:hypothetical protein [Planctomycetota bacterium]